MFKFCKSIFTNSMRCLIMGSVVWRFSVMYIEIGPLSSCGSACFLVVVTAVQDKIRHQLSRREISCFSVIGAC